MAVPTVMSDLSTTIASNAPAGSESPTNADDFLRAIQGIVRREASSGSDIASASTITPDALASSYNVTGTTAITAIGSTNSWDGRIIVLRFTGALTFTHGATLVLPGAANITTASGDFAVVRQRTSGTWDCLQYTFASGQKITGTLAVTGAATVSSTLGVTGAATFSSTVASAGVVTIGAAGTGTGGNVQLKSDDGTLRYHTGVLGTGGATAWSVYDAVAGATRLNITSAGQVTTAAQPSVTLSNSAERTTTGTFGTYTESTDQGAIADNAAGTITVPVAGRYAVSILARAACTSAGSQIVISLYNNGANAITGTDIYLSPPGDATIFVTGSATFYISLAASDVLRCELQTLSGTGATTHISIKHFGLHLMG